MGTNYLDFKRELLKDKRNRYEYYKLVPKYFLIGILLRIRNVLKVYKNGD